MKALWFFPLVGLGLLSGAAAEEGRKPIPLYTNADLDRLSPYRGQTGVLSEPAVDAPRTAPPAREERVDEAYWRREAARVRERVGTLRERADEVRREIQQAVEEARSRPWTSRGPRGSGSTPALASREKKLAALEASMRELEADLQDRARRARALPGWLR